MSQSLPVTCQFDQTQHETLEGFHAHLRENRVSQKLYYTSYHKKVDRLTGEPIEYKDRDQYLSAEFASKENLRRWLSLHVEEGKAWARAWLTNRRAAKGLVYAPSQTELRTLVCPSMPYYDAMFAAEGGYYGVVKTLGFETRYGDHAPAFTPPARDWVLVEDSREQAPLRTALTTRTEALTVGDYALAAPHDAGTRIERKSLADFCGTMSGRQVTHDNKKKAARVDSSLARFTRELARARESNLYVVMMVECDIAKAQLFGHLPETKHVKASASYLFHNLRSLLIEFPLHFQALFVDGRAEMERVVVKTLQLGTQVKELDLQSLYEKGVL